LYHLFNISDQILRNTNIQHAVVMYQLHKTSAFVESKFKTPIISGFLIQHSPTVHQLAGANDFMCYIYVLLYLYFIPFHISRT